MPTVHPYTMPLTLSSSRISGLCFFWALIFSPPAYTQDQVPKGGVLTVTSRLVTLDVSVMDAKGKPVTDLTKADFMVYENGEMQTVRHFDGFNAHDLSPALTAASIKGAADLERVAPNAPVSILVLDEFNTDFSDNAYARFQLKKYLTAQPAVLKQPTTFLAATDGGFRQIQDYTLDRQRLLDSLAHLPAVLPGGLMRTGDSPEGAAIRFAQTLDSLQQVAKASVGHKGRKNVIWVGRGFQSINLENETDHQIELVRGAAERTVNLLREAHVTIYTVDPTLATKLIAEIDDTAGAAGDPTAFAAEAHDPTDPFNGTVSFNTLAPLTGGAAFSVFNDLEAEIATSIAEGSAYYSLSYVPVGAADNDNPYRRIDVRVNRPGVTVITRHGYYSATPPEPARSPKQEIKSEGYDIGSAIESGITFTGLSLTASLPASRPGECVVQVATRDIQWETQDDGSVSAHLTLVAVAIDAHGNHLTDTKKDVVAKLKDPQKLIQMPYATLSIDIPHAKNAKSIRVAVRDTVSGKIGTAEFPLN